jgi:hypothetical protein
MEEVRPPFLAQIVRGRSMTFLYGVECCFIDQCGPIFLAVKRLRDVRIELTTFRFRQGVL